MKIGILCPKGAVTGGPEALHQLYAEIAKSGCHVRLFDSEEGYTRETPAQEYDSYGPLWAESDEEIAQLDFLIIPEVFSHLSKKRFSGFKGEFVIWWLSVDNSGRLKPFTERTMKLSSPSRHWVRGKPSPMRHWGNLAYAAVQQAFLLARSLSGELQPVAVKRSLHIAQSFYAADFAKRAFGVDVQIVSDFIPDDSSELTAEQGPVVWNLVTFNGSKGAEFCKLVKDHCPELNFVALQGFSRKEVSRLLSISALYLDLGHFPGKDRLPREAAKLGTPVLISNRGAGGTLADFDLSQEFLVDLRTETPKGVGLRVSDIVASRERAALSQTAFAKTQRCDRQRFASQVLDFIESLELRRGRG